MKVVLGDHILWRDEPARIIAETTERVVTIEMEEHAHCPYCCGDLGVEQFDIVADSLLFRENAKVLK